MQNSEIEIPQGCTVIITNKASRGKTLIITMIKIAPLTPMYTEYFKLIELELNFEFEFCILGLKFYIIIR